MIRRLPFIAVAGPALLVAAIEVAMLALGVAGAHPRWHVEPPLNLSEAAAVRDVAEVARLLDAGEDPNATRPIRAGVLGPEPTSATPVEAAEAIGREEIAALLRAHGAR